MLSYLSRLVPAEHTKIIRTYAPRGLIRTSIAVLQQCKAVTRPAVYDYNDSVTEIFTSPAFRNDFSSSRDPYSILPMRV